jgi:hypothetical protein
MAQPQRAWQLLPRGLHGGLRTHTRFVGLQKLGLCGPQWRSRRGTGPWGSLPPTGWCVEGPPCTGSLQVAPPLTPAPGVVGAWSAARPTDLMLLFWVDRVLRWDSWCSSW